jgi:hypothetical protein
LGILDTHQARVQLVAGAHIHRNEFRDPLSMLYSNLSVPFLITPSISPDYLNNPSYTKMVLDGSSFASLRIESFQL